MGERRRRARTTSSAEPFHRVIIERGVSSHCLPGLLYGWKMMAPKRQTRQGTEAPFAASPPPRRPSPALPRTNSQLQPSRASGQPAVSVVIPPYGDPKRVPWATRHRLSMCSSAQLPSWAKAEAEARCCQACVADFDRRPAAFIIHQDGWNAAAVAVLPRALM